jgi:hypothetical protein
MSTRIIIPSCDDGNLLPCLSALHANGANLLDVTVLDSGVYWPPIVESLFHGTRITRIVPPPPFSYSRFCNIGLRLAHSYEQDALLLNDDALLETLNGVALLEEIALEENMQLLSPHIQGIACNPHQTRRDGQHLKPAQGNIAFVAVFIPWDTLDEVGFLDERFDETCYGGEDLDYCRRILENRGKIMITEDVTFRHDGTLPSSFRTLPHYKALAKRGDEVYRDKWGQGDKLGGED